VVPHGQQLGASENSESTQDLKTSVKVESNPEDTKLMHPHVFTPVSERKSEPIHDVEDNDAGELLDDLVYYQIQNEVLQGELQSLQSNPLRRFFSWFR
jgi:hypothetical protein